MQYFKRDFIHFFIELSQNNNKSWFDVNRKRYEESVKIPFYNFVQDYIELCRNFEPNLNPEAKDAIFRINRDIRFSKDKTPYKTNVSALISPKGRKDISSPGFYLEINATQIKMYGGIYMPDHKQISAIRNFIKENDNTFISIINQSDFVEKFQKIQGVQQTRLPKEMKEVAEKQPLLYNKQWYIHAELPVENILENEFINLLLEYFKASLPLSQFIKSALD